jgi:hypothetical protein
VRERTAFKKGSPLVSGRTLFKLANNSLRTIWKAIYIAVQLVEIEEQPKHSGTTSDAVKAKVLKEMYAMMKGKCSLDDCVEEEGTEEVTDEEKRDMPIVANVDKGPEGLFLPWIYGFFGLRTIGSNSKSHGIIGNR